MELPSVKDIFNKIRTKTSQARENRSARLLNPNQEPERLPSSEEILNKVKGTTFTENLKTTATQIKDEVIKPAARATVDFAKDQVDLLNPRKNLGLRTTASDLGEGVKDTAIGAWKGSVYMAKAINEGVVALTKTATEAIVKEKGMEKIAQSPVGRILGRFERDITGRETPKSSVQEFYRKSKKQAYDMGADDSEANTFAGIAVIGYAFMENPLFTPGKVTTIPAKTLKGLAESQTRNETIAILQTQFPKAKPEQLEVIAAMTIPLKDATEINDLFTRLQGTSNQLSGKLPSSEEILQGVKATEAPTQEALPTSAEILQKVKAGETPTQPNLIGQADEMVVDKPVDSVPTTKPAEISTKVVEPNPTMSLEAEAKKYKSAEEFVKANRITVTDQTVKQFPRLGELLDSPRLFAKFPDLKEVSINIIPKARNAADMGTTGEKISNNLIFLDSRTYFDKVYKDGYVPTGGNDDIFQVVGYKVKPSKKDDLIKSIIHEVEHVKQNVYRNIKSDFKDPTFKDPDIVRRYNTKVQSGVFGDDAVTDRGIKYVDSLAEKEATRREGTYKTEDELTELWNKVNTTSRSSETAPSPLSPTVDTSKSRCSLSDKVSS